MYLYRGIVLSALLSSMMITSPASIASESVSENHSHHMAAHTEKAAMAEIVHTQGVIKRILPEQGQLIIQHEAIPEWQMMAMQMKFGLAPELSIDDFSVGQQIRFRLHQENMMRYTILELLP
ncbi:MAG: copper-binding protein [Amphritea sp.]|nr:copper-binding protein [Amphritea sp.]